MGVESKLGDFMITDMNNWYSQVGRIDKVVSTLIKWEGESSPH